MRQRPIFSRYRRWAIASLALVCVVSCRTTRPTTPEALRGDGELRESELELHYGKASVVLEAGWQLDYPWVVGKEEDRRGEVPRQAVDGEPEMHRYNLEDTTRIALRDLDRKKSWALGLGIGVASAGVLYVLLAAIAAAAILGSASCPAVLVADSVSPPQLVGEAYPGATGREMQRLDWLALPTPAGGSPISITIDNHHREIQHIASAELAFIAHPPGTTALATPRGALVVVDDLRPPLRAEVAGADVLEQVSAADGLYWQTPQREIRLGGSEVIEATLEAPDATGSVLVVRFENTLFQGFLQASRIGEACAGDIRAARSGSDLQDCATWRREEGFDAVAAIDDGVRSERLDLGAAGVDGARTVALPLRSSSGPVRVRIEGGSGFLRIDQIALAHLVDDAPPVERFAPARASRRSAAGSVQTLAANAGPVVLEQSGERLELEFRPGPLRSPGSWFLAVDGFYELQPEARQILARAR